MKQQNDYLGLLEHDYIQVKNPYTNRMVKLYRVIALRTFRIDPVEVKNGLGPYNENVLDRFYRELKRDYDKLKSSISKLEKQYNVALKEYNELLEERKKTKGIYKNGWSEGLQRTFEKAEILRKSLESDLVKSQTKLQKQKSEMSDFKSTKKTWPFFGILKDTIGGYVESLDVFNNKPSWVGNNAMVYGDCIIENSYIVDSAVICGKNDRNIDNKCTVINSFVKNSSRILGTPYITNSILRDSTEIRDFAEVENTLMINSSLIFENAQVRGSILNTGTYCRANALVIDSILTHTSHCERNSIVKETILDGNVSVIDRTVENENLKVDLNLRSRIYEGD